MPSSGHFGSTFERSSSQLSQPDRSKLAEAERRKVKWVESADIEWPQRTNRRVVWRSRLVTLKDSLLWNFQDWDLPGQKKLLAKRTAI